MSDQIGHATTCSLYRAYDSTGVLLYAGVTTNVKRRMAEHRGKKWVTQVAHVEIEEFPSRWRAALAERVSGHGRHGLLPGGIGKGIAAAMTDEELAEAMEHPAYSRWSDEAIARAWGLKVAKVRALRAGVDRMAVRGWLGKR